MLCVFYITQKNESPPNGPMKLETVSHTVQSLAEDLCDWLITQNPELKVKFFLFNIFLILQLYRAISSTRVGRGRKKNNQSSSEKVI